MAALKDVIANNDITTVTTKKHMVPNSNHSDDIAEETEKMLEAFEENEINDLQQRLQSSDDHQNQFMSLLSRLKKVESEYTALKQQYLHHVHQIDSVESNAVNTSVIHLLFGDKSVPYHPVDPNTSLSLPSLQQFISTQFKLNVFWLRYKNEDGTKVVIHDHNDLLLAVQCAQLHHNNQLNILVVQYIDTQIPFHRYTVDDVCSLITKWLYTDINYKLYLSKTKEIFNSHALNGQKMIYLSGDDAKRIVKEEMLQFMTVNTLNIMFDGFNEWQKYHRDRIMLKNAEQIGYMLYEYPLKQLIKQFRVQQMDGIRMIQIINDETNDMLQRTTGWKNEEIEQIQLICFTKMTFTKKQFTTIIDDVLSNADKEDEKEHDEEPIAIPQDLLDKIKTALLEDDDVDIEQIQFDIKHTRNIAAFSDKMVNLVDGLLADLNVPQSEFVARIYTKISECFACHHLDEMDAATDTPRYWVCCNCNNCNYSTFMDGKLNHDVYICSLCGLSEVQSIAMKVRNYDTFTAIESHVNISTTNETKDAITERIQSVIESYHIDLVCLNLNSKEKTQCPSILRLAKQLIAYNNWLKAIKVYDFKSTLDVKMSEYINADIFKAAFLESIQSINRLTQNDIDALRTMLDQNINNICDISSFLEADRKSFATKIKQHTKLSISFGYRIYAKMKKLLKHKAQKEKFGTFIAELDMDTIDKDYHHILKSHVHNGDKNSIKNVFRFFSSVVHYEDTQTNLEALQCKSVKRRMQVANAYNEKQDHPQSINKDTEKDIWKLQQYYNQHQLDVIHSYLVHSKWQRMVLLCSHDGEFADDANQVNEEIKEEDETEEAGLYRDIKDRYISSGADYGFGVVHEYHRLQPIYPSMYDELIHNKQCALHEMIFQNLLIKAIKKHAIALSQFKTKLICKHYDINYRLIRNTAIQIRHILALVIYTDLTHFCTAFRATYRKLNDETEHSVTERHRELYYYSRALFESVEFFGEFMEPQLKVYHGLNKQMKFQQFTAFFHQPISTTTTFQSALQFSQGSGIILTLKSGAKYVNEAMKIPKYLSVAWLSSFPQEDEKLYYGDYVVFQIHNIHSFGDNRCVEHLEELLIFNTFQQMVQNQDVNWNKATIWNASVALLEYIFKRGMHSKPKVAPVNTAKDTNKSKDVDAMHAQLLSHANALIAESRNVVDYPKNFSKYGIELFDYFCNQTTWICIRNFHSLPKPLKAVLFENEDAEISMFPMLRLFPFLKEIVLNQLEVQQMTADATKYANAVLEYVENKNVDDNKLYGVHFTKISFKSKPQADNKENSTLKKLQRAFAKKLKPYQWTVKYQFHIENAHVLTFTNDVLETEDKIRSLQQKLIQLQHQQMESEAQDKDRIKALIKTNETNASQNKTLTKKVKALKRRDEVNKQLRDNWNKQLNQMENAVLLANEIYNRERTRHEAEISEKEVEILKLRKFLLSFTDRHKQAKNALHKLKEANPLKSNNANANATRRSKIAVPKVIKAGALKFKPGANKD